MLMFSFNDICKNHTCHSNAAQAKIILDAVHNSLVGFVLCLYVRYFSLNVYNKGFQFVSIVLSTETNSGIRMPKNMLTSTPTLY